MASFAALAFREGTSESQNSAENDDDDEDSIASVDNLFSSNPTHSGEVSTREEEEGEAASSSSPSIVVSSSHDANSRALYTLVNNALFSPSEAEVQALIQKGANVLWKNEKGYSALIKACYHGHIAAVATIIVTDVNSINVRDNVGYAPFMIACCHGRTVSAKTVLTAANQYLRNNFDINLKDYDGLNALMLGVLSGHFDVVNLILGDPLVRVNEKNSEGRTALELVDNADCSFSVQAEMRDLFLSELALAFDTIPCFLISSFSH
jgi:ankyrin repeat protein